MDAQNTVDFTEWSPTVQSIKEWELEKIIEYYQRTQPTNPLFPPLFKALLEKLPGCGKTVKTPSGEIAGLCFAIPIDDDTGYLFGLSVMENLRGRGIGSLLVKSALRDLGERNVHLTSYRDKAQFWSRFGFKCDKISKEIWQGRINKTSLSNFRPRPETRLDRMNAKNIKEDVIPYCETNHPFLSFWFLEKCVADDPNLKGVVAIEETKVFGFAYLLESLSTECFFFCIVYSDTYQVAEQLFSYLSKEFLHAEDIMRVCLSTRSSEACHLAEAIGLEKFFEVDPMYTKAPLPVNWDNVIFSNPSRLWPY